MAIPPWQPVVPPEWQALMNQGNYREALRRGATEFGKQIVKQGPRIVQPIAQSAATTFRALGMTAEAGEILVAAETFAASPAAAQMLAASRIAGILEGIMTSGPTILAACEGAVPLLIICLGIGLLMCLNARPAPAEPLKKEYRNLKNEVERKIPNKKGSLWDSLPKPGNA